MGTAGAETNAEQGERETTTEPPHKATDGTLGNGADEQKQDTSERNPDDVLHAKCAKSVHLCGRDPDLALIVERWSDLHEAIKEHIMTMIDSEGTPDGY